MSSSIQSALNNLTPDKFLMRVSVLPNLSFRIKQTQIPGLSVAVPQIGNRASQRFKPTAYNVELSPLNVTFVVDEELRNWMEAFNWFKLCTKSDDLFEDGILAEISILVLDSDLKEVLELQLQDCVPVSLSDINLAVDDESTTLLATVTIDYSTYKIKTPLFEVSYD